MGKIKTAPMRHPDPPKHKMVSEPVDGLTAKCTTEVIECSYCGSNTYRADNCRNCGAPN